METVEETGLKEGDIVEVKLLDVDPKTGKFKLSRKALLPRPERTDRPDRPDRPEREDRPPYRPDNGGFKGKRGR